MNSASPRGISLSKESIPLKRLLRSTFWAGLILSCALPAGCQKSLLQNIQQAELTLPLNEKTTKQIPQELEGLNVYLSQDLWVRNHHWTAYQEWKTLKGDTQLTTPSSINVHRWVFGSLKDNQILADAENKEEPASTPSDPESESKDTSTKKEDLAQNSPPETDQSDEKTKSPSENWSFNSLQNFLVGSGTNDSKSKMSSTQSPGKVKALKQLSEWNSLAGWNATILWASLEPATALDAIPILETIIFDDLAYDQSAPNTLLNDDASSLDRNLNSKKSNPELKSLSSAMKHAAINALCLVLSRADAIPLKTKNRLTQSLQRPDISLELRGELYRGLARIIPPAEIPSIELSLNANDDKIIPPKNLRRAAMDACIIHGLWFYADQAQLSPQRESSNQFVEFDASTWPANMMQVRWDSDPEIRANFGLWAASIGHPETASILTSQLKDADLTVQNKAIEHLGILGTENALALLLKHSKRPQESSRVSAAVGLTPWGVKHLAPLIDDTASSVRRTVAEGLGHTATPEATLLLRSLISDRNSEVQLTVIDSISEWPDDLAIPLLLEGIQEGTFKTRRKSILQLIKRTGSGGSISIEASKAERIAAVRELVQTEQLPSGLWNQLMNQGLQKERAVDTRRQAEIQAYFQTLINQSPNTTQYHDAYQELSHLSSNELRILEKRIQETSIELPETIYTDLLPKLDPTYSALNELSSIHIVDRRKAAQELLTHSQKVSLSPIIVKRLRKLMPREQDRLVWRIVMASIAKDNYEETAQLALLAINHNWPDIKVLGCTYLGSHGLPQYAIWLLPLLEDKNQTVQLAAINAIGHCHNPLAITGMISSAPDHKQGPSLRSLMTHSNQRVRFETIAALSRLGDVQGMQEMVRLTSDKLNSTRLDAVREMGNSRQTRFVEPLVQLAWTERNYSTLKEILISLEKLVPESEQPAELTPQMKQTEQAKVWMNWWQTHHAGPSSRLFTGR